MERYSDSLLKHYYSGDFVGRMNEKDSAVYTGEVGSEEGGEVVRVQIKINDNAIIEDICFKAHGSCATIAAAAFVCEQLKNKSVDEINKLTAEKIVKALEMPKVKIHSALLAIDACKNAIDKIVLDPRFRENPEN